MNTQLELEIPEADITLNELYHLLGDTAIDIATATTTTFQWPALIAHLLRTLEPQAPQEKHFEDALSDICVRIQRRLSQGRW